MLQQTRALIAAAAPDATETISYAIPTFDLNGTHLVHFAGYERHLGLYPTASGIAAFAQELKPYKSARGSVQFPLGEPLPDRPHPPDRRVPGGRGRGPTRPAVRPRPAGRRPAGGRFTASAVPAAVARGSGSGSCPP